jgi:hypothetical protein
MGAPGNSAQEAQWTEAEQRPILDVLERVDAYLCRVMRVRPGYPGSNTTWEVIKFGVRYLPYRYLPYRYLAVHRPGGSSAWAQTSEDLGTTLARFCARYLEDVRDDGLPDAPGSDGMPR